MRIGKKTDSLGPAIILIIIGGGWVGGIKISIKYISFNTTQVYY